MVWLVSSNVFTHSSDNIVRAILCHVVILSCLTLYPSAVGLTVDDVLKGFDSRTHWPKCAPVISRIRNQGECNSCWVIAPADTLRDRLCIHNAYSPTISEYSRDRFAQDSSEIENISVMDVLSCSKFSRREGVCLSGGRPETTWHRFATVGATSEDSIESGSEFAYSFPPCNHTIPSTALWLATRQRGGLSIDGSGNIVGSDDGMERSFAAHRGVLPFCSRRNVLTPPECPPSADSRRRKKILSSERIGGNEARESSEMEPMIMEELLAQGPLQATMIMYPSLSTVPFGPLDELSVYPLVYRCDSAEWLRRMQQSPTAAENQRRHHAVRIIGWGSVKFNVTNYEGLFATPVSDLEPRVERGKSAGRVGRARTSVGSERSAAVIASQKSRSEAVLGRNSGKNRFAFTSADIATPLEQGSDVVHYWIVANSWGPEWGHNGFFYIQRGPNDCRISQSVWKPIVH